LLWFFEQHPLPASTSKTASTYKQPIELKSMNKRKILALTALAIADGAYAQPSFSLYGEVDASVVHISMPENSVTGMASGGRSGSNIGVRGEEDLGGGYKLSFQLESSFKADGADHEIKPGGRIKLLGSFGEFQTGKLSNMLSDMRDGFNATGGSGIIGINASNMISGTAIGSINGSSSWSSPNGIAYLSPNVGGFSGRIGYSFGEQAGNNRLGSNTLMRVGYSSGPVQLATGYALARGGTDAEGVSYRTFQLGASYKTGGFQPMLQYVTERGNSKRIDLYSAGWKFYQGSSEYRMGYTWFQDKTQNDANSQRIAFGYSYALSKRTRLFCSIAHMRNEKKASRKFAGSLSHSVVAGSNISGHEVGLNHTF
jgi:predicted porin